MSHSSPTLPNSKPLCANSVTNSPIFSDHLIGWPCVTISTLAKSHFYLNVAVAPRLVSTSSFASWSLLPPHCSRVNLCRCTSNHALLSSHLAHISLRIETKAFNKGPTDLKPSDPHSCSCQTSHCSFSAHHVFPVTLQKHLAHLENLSPQLYLLPGILFS